MRLEDYEEVKLRTGLCSPPGLVVQDAISSVDTPYIWLRDRHIYTHWREANLLKRNGLLVHGTGYAYIIRHF